MRPRSAAPSKGGALLPTITEEAAKDRNEVKTPRLSSDDYLLSICHLAHPTFPAGHDPAGPRARARPSRLNRGQKGRDDDGAERRRQLGASDPLEYLYGRESYPGPSDGRQLEGERERERPSPAVPPPAAILGLPRPRRGGRSEEAVPGGSAPTGEAGKDGKAKGGEGTPGKRRWVVSQWISDCRSAWREGRMSACVLPVIAEI
ncbi:LOW QUALITY PROTEIN: uncharacterized protein LOC144082567 [Stigmatopora argus]